MFGTLGKIVVVWLVVVVFVAPVATAADARPANVLLIMTDNHGAWTLGCYGNRDIQTPRIDRLASEGMRFTRAFASNAVCSPTRATYLTGLIPSQHGVHCFLGLEGTQMGPKAYCTIGEFGSLPKMLAARGYRCGLSGKWHLGANLTPQEGFTEWTTMPHGGTIEFYDAEVIEDGKVRREPGSLTDLWTQRAVSFLERNQAKPFFLFLSYNGPYGLGKLLLQPSRNRHVAYYADKELPSFPREAMHPWQFDNKPYLNNPVSIRRYAEELSGVDDGVGEVLDTLRRLGLEQNTLVIFCADQGWMGGQNGVWGMGDHTRPLGAMDGMMQVPLLFRQPGVIPAGATSDLMVSNYDVLPTVLGQLGMGDAMPDKPRSPGRDFSATLRGQKQSWDNEVYYEMENVRCIRTETWKFVTRHPEGPHELYSLADDPGERFNRYGQPADATVQRELAGRLEAFFTKYADPKYDLYRGGTSKAKLLTQRK
ncbi:MAG: sulfatase-like hydrolase/transferase [Planctomycetes bacterium]|nr:sulfatase-like hydrolase/transferase [Planctomycetota bacterium]